MALVGNLVVALTAKTKGLTDGLNSARKRLNKFSGNVTDALGTVSKLHAGLVALAGAGGIGLMVASQLTAIDTLAKTADKLGVTTDALAGMRIAAERTGVASNTLDMAIQRMTRRLSEAAMGTGEAKSALKELGVDAVALSRMSPDKALGVIADALLQVGNQADRVRLAFKLFDSEGVALVNTLALGSEGLAMFQAEAERLGVAIDRVDAAKVEMLNDQIAAMVDRMRGLQMQLTVELTPIISTILDKLESLTERQDKLGKETGIVTKAYIVLVEALQAAKSILVLNIFAVASLTEGVVRSSQAFFTMAGQLPLVGDQFKAVADAIGVAADEVGFYRQGLLQVIEEGFTFGDVADDLARKTKEMEDAAAKAADATDDHAEAMRRAAEEAARLKKEQEELNRLTREAERIFDNTRTPLEKFEAQIKKLRELLSKGLIDEDTFSRAVKQAEADLARSTAKAVTKTSPVVKAATQAREPRTADFRQVRLSTLALQGTFASTAQKSATEQTQKIIEALLKRIAEKAENPEPMLIKFDG